MIKKYFILSIISTFLLSNDMPVKNQDVSPQQLKKQNKQIVQLAAEQLSKNLPQTIDKYTTITKIEPKDSELIYTFEINTGAKSDKTVQKEDRTRMKKAITKGICTRSKRFMEAEITITYKYISKSSNAELFKFNIAQKDCLYLNLNYKGRI